MPFVLNKDLSAQVISFQQPFRFLLKELRLPETATAMELHNE